MPATIVYERACSFRFPARSGKARRKHRSRRGSDSDLNVTRRKRIGPSPLPTRTARSGKARRKHRCRWGSDSDLDVTRRKRIGPSPLPTRTEVSHGIADL